MSVLLITYDQSEMNSSVDPVLSLVQEYKHVQLSENSYAIETDEKTRTIFNKIMPYLSSSAHLFIVTLVKPFAGPVLEHVSNWLSKHLPED
ncbi:MAG: hypothetical protein HY033_12310 [Ignavibacteriae bacterium]|nr:hypothetical protein [Ignavibacteria bacterium]MBI3365675.1 hypothetical protein [Ignavibacteriota bacterium]